MTHPWFVWVSSVSDLQALQSKLANHLFNVSAEKVSLEPIEAGLSHHSFSCRIDEQRYFIKVYRPSVGVAVAVRQINQLTEYMCNRGIPASRVCLYSPGVPNVVVHDFVEGEMHAGQKAQIGAIAGLYSSLALLGAEHPQFLSKIEYLDGIHGVVEQMKLLESEAIMDLSIHAGMQALGESALALLHAGLGDEGLLHIHIHDDFTEKNILLKNDRVQLLCDWDSYRLKLLIEHFACCVARFSTEKPLTGEIMQEKLKLFLRSLHPEYVRHIADLESFASLFPVLATLKHLRTYMFRNLLVQQNRVHLKTPQLTWPLHHCRQLLANRQEISNWVYQELKTY